jgi:hypothetical protein
MKNDIDGLIAEALTEDERQFLADLEEPSLMQQGLDLFRGRSRTLNLAIAVVMTLFSALTIYCLYRFLGTSDPASLIRWGAGMFYGLAVIAAMKIWSWMELQSNSLRRELKRVELQLASLANKLGDRS